MRGFTTSRCFFWPSSSSCCEIWGLRCVILGGLGSIRGTLLGVFALVGLDIIASPVIDGWLQNWIPDGGRLLSFSNWRLMIFGLALILMMRFRPEGLLPSVRVQHELHNQ